MARLMRAIRSGAAGAAIALWAGAAMAAPVPQDAGQQVSSDDSEAPEDYAWIDRADALWDAIGDAPPDYSFAFEDGEPWAWETEDGYWIVVEDTPDGMLSYYFEPGAEGPFLVREAERSFGYDGGDVAMVYDAGGGALPQAEGAAYLDEGDELYDRGVRLHAMLGERNWQPVDTTAWVDTSFVLIGLQNQWDLGRRRHIGWQRHRALPQVIAQHGRWDAEHRRRADMAQQFRRWREGGYRGTAPGRTGGWVHRPPRPDRAEGRPGRPGGQPPVPGAGTRPGTGGVVARPPGDVRETPGRPGRGPRPGGKLSEGPAGVVTPTPVTRPGRGSWRGGDGQPGRDRPGRPGRDAAVPAVPAAGAPPQRPAFTRPARPAVTPPAAGAPPQRPNYTRPTRPAGTPPAAGAPPSRPAYTPPPQRPSAGAAPRPSTPRPAPPSRPARAAREKVD